MFSMCASLGAASSGSDDLSEMQIASVGSPKTKVKEPAVTETWQIADERRLEWDKLSDAVDHLGPNWLYRGQREAAWDLRTSLERHTPKGMVSSEAERRLLKEFQRRAHNYLQPHQVPTETGEWLAVMQHFGAPTRLLDFTRSPYVAIYFAVEDAGSPDGDFAVWAVNTQWCKACAGAAIFVAYPKERETWEKTRASGSITAKGPLEHFVGTYHAEQGPMGWQHSTVAMTFPFRPEKLTERLTIQQGEFLAPQNVDVPFMKNLFCASPPEGYREMAVIKFVIAGQQRNRILEQLRLMNITRATLFPGIDGFAQSFR